MGYDRGESFPLDFEPNGNPIGSKLKGKLSPRSYPIQFERKWKHSFLSAGGLLDAILKHVRPHIRCANVDTGLLASS